MKTNSKFVKWSQIVAVLCLSIGGCQKIDNNPMMDDSNKIMPGLSYDKLILDNTPSSAKVGAVNAPAPTVTKVTTKVGCDNCVTLNSVLIPWIGQQNFMEIVGTNFGTSVGKSIVITDINGKTQSSYSFALLAWSDNAIRLQTGASLTALPITLKFTITTSDGRVVTTQQNIEPVISQKRFGSEPYFVNRRRIEMGFQPLPTGLYISGVSLNANYIPQRGDAWIFPSISKQSIVVSVSSRIQSISSNKFGAVDDFIYEVTTAELQGNMETNMGRQIIIRRTTTIYSNAPKGYSYQLMTPASSAFNSVIKGQVATQYYR